MLLCSTLLADEGFAHAFPTRGTVDARLCAHLGTDAVVQTKQVHGGRCVEANAPPGTEADAIVARVRASRPEAIAVGVRVADCLPLLLADPINGSVAAVHVGWRGVVAQVVPAAVEALAGGPLLAAIGPCIGACCFEVARDVGARIALACGGMDGIIAREAGDKAYVDLRAAVRAQLLSLGVRDERIEDVPGCTKDDPARFHSYRRDGAASGRMLAAIATRR